MSDDLGRIIAFEESEFHRRELREYDDSFAAVILRPKVGGGWYVRDIIVISKNHEEKEKEANP